MICRIPVAHLHGGEATEGLIDEAIRHSITKMSHLHFVATETYKKRVIQLGENPSRVFNVGGFGIDNIVSLDFLDKQSLESSLNFTLRERNFLITFHPVTLENATAQEQFKALLDALKSLSTRYDIGYIFTKANADTDGRIINDMIDEFVSTHSNAIAFTSMGQLRYLSTMRFVNAVVGNSSSGLGEAPSFKVATINIGDRQKGRLMPESVLTITPNPNDEKAYIQAILDSIHTITSKDFMDKAITHPFGNGTTSQQMIQILQNTLYNDTINLKKAFYDIEP